MDSLFFENPNHFSWTIQPVMFTFLPLFFGRDGYQAENSLKNGLTERVAVPVGIMAVTRSLMEAGSLIFFQA